MASEDEIVIGVGADRDGRRQTVEVAFDGSHNVELSTGDRIRIRRSDQVTRIIKLSRVSFLEVLHKKMED